MIKNTLPNKSGNPESLKIIIIIIIIIIIAVQNLFN